MAILAELEVQRLKSIFALVALPILVVPAMQAVEQLEVEALVAQQLKLVLQPELEVPKPVAKLTEELMRPEAAVVPALLQQTAQEQYYLAELQAVAQIELPKPVESKLA